MSDVVWIVEKADKDEGNWYPYDVYESEEQAILDTENIQFAHSLYYKYRVRRFVAAEKEGTNERN